MTEISLRLPVDPDELAAELSGEMDHEQLIEFILHIDEYTADLDFTKKLVKKLNKVIKKEKEVEEATPLALNWHPNRIQGFKFNGEHT